MVETTHGTEIVPADCIKHGSGAFSFAHQAANDRNRASGFWGDCGY
jgi:hypothetical protein